MKSQEREPNIAPPRSKNWLLTKFRSLHGWGGIIAALFLLIFGTTGIVLNYKKPIFEAIGLETPKEMVKKADEKPAKKEKEKRESGSASLQIGTALQQNVTFEQALATAKERWGDVPLENIQLKDERGQLIYKVKQKEGDELWIEAATGKAFLKAEYQKIEIASEGKATSRFDWGKLFLDLHTGKIGGEAGKAIMSLASLVLLFLTISGIYLWTVPIWRKRQSGKAQAIAADAKTATPAIAVRRNNELVRT